MRYNRKNIVNEDEKFERTTANDKVSYGNNERLTDDGIKGRVHAHDSQKNNPSFPNQDRKKNSTYCKR